MSEKLNNNNRLFIRTAVAAGLTGAALSLLTSCGLDKSGYTQQERNQLESTLKPAAAEVVQGVMDSGVQFIVSTEGDYFLANEHYEGSGVSGSMNIQIDRAPTDTVPDPFNVTSIYVTRIVGKPGDANYATDHTEVTETDSDYSSNFWGGSSSFTTKDTEAGMFVDDGHFVNADTELEEAKGIADNVKSEASLFLYEQDFIQQK